MAMEMILVGMTVVMIVNLLTARRVRAGTVLGESCRVPADSRQEYARYVRFRPGDGQVVTLNPPRFSWPYLPEILFREGEAPADQRFTLQISKASDFGDVAVEVRDTECNFYNFLPALEEARTWYWRVGYNVGTGRETWSDVRSFALAEDAVTWDRSRFGDLLNSLSDHPRILFNRENRDAVLAMQEKDAFSEALARHIIARADRALAEPWYSDFPKGDDDPTTNYMNPGLSLVSVAFAYLLTGDGKYGGFKDRILEMASWPPGGYSAPEGGGSITKWPTHLTECFGLIYDWFYDSLTAGERATLRGALEWRIAHTMRNFAWRAQEGAMVPVRSVAARCASHPYENLMVTIPGMLAICDESEAVREWLEIGLNHLVGITSAMGEDEGWNEGPGYGSGKMKWQTDATCYLLTALPELDLGKNPMYSAYCEFFARLTPIGARHTSFGNRGLNEWDWCGSRVTNFRRVAMLRGDSQAMQNWTDTRRRLADIGRREAMPFSPWIDYVLPFYLKEPAPAPEENSVGLFPLEGWVMAGSAPPSDYDAQKDAVSMSFACRPRGGYSHAFRSENGFDIHAYGETVTVGGDNTSNQSYFANHTMSHNTILVNGREQRGAADEAARVCGRIIAFHQGEDFVYWAGDATPAYGEDSGLGKFVRHVVFVDHAYFVMFDDLAMRGDADPAAFQWLYHIPEYVPLDFDAEAFRLRYAVGKTEVAVQHVAHVEDLTFRDHRGEEGMVNPLTGEDVTRRDKGGTFNALREAARQKGWTPKEAAPPLDAHHIWISHETPRLEMQFLAAIVPFRAGEEEPVVERVSDTAVRVAFRRKARVVSFGVDGDADIGVDVGAIGVGF